MPYCDVPEGGHNERNGPRVDHRHRGGAMNDDDPTRQRESAQDPERQRACRPMHSESSPEAPQRKQQRSKHHGPQDRVPAQGAQSKRRERTDDQWRPGTAERSDNGAQYAGTIGSNIADTRSRIAGLHLTA